MERQRQTPFLEIDGYKIERLISENEIATAVERLADEIYEDYKDKNPLFIVILKGANTFATDLSREMGRGNPEIAREPKIVEMGFKGQSSYGESEVTSGEVETTLDLDTDISGRDVIIVEDILDTGLTLKDVQRKLSSLDPKSLKICVLLDKKERRKVQISADYTGLEIPDKFVVGYGLDTNERFRNLPFIGAVIS